MLKQYKGLALQVLQQVQATSGEGWKPAAGRQSESAGGHISERGEEKDCGANALLSGK